MSDFLASPSRSSDSSCAQAALQVVCVVISLVVFCLSAALSFDEFGVTFLFEEHVKHAGYCDAVGALNAHATTYATMSTSQQLSTERSCLTGAFPYYETAPEPSQVSCAENRCMARLATHYRWVHYGVQLVAFVATLRSVAVLRDFFAEDGEIAASGDVSHVWAIAANAVVALAVTLVSPLIGVPVNWPLLFALVVVDGAQWACTWFMCHSLPTDQEGDQDCTACSSSDDTIAAVQIDVVELKEV